MADSSDLHATPRPRRTGSSDPNATPQPVRRSSRLAERNQVSVTATASPIAPTDPEDERGLIDGLQGSWDEARTVRGFTSNAEDVFSGKITLDDDGSTPEFGRYEAAWIQSLFDLVRTQMPPPPDYYKEDDTLSATKSMSKTERNMAQEGGGPLEKLVYAPDMLSPLLVLAEAQLKELEFDPQNIAHLDFATFVHPWHTAVDLPPHVHSEKDTEDWVNATLLRPALTAALAYMKKSMTVSHRNINAKQPASDSACWKPKDPFYISSSDGQSRIIPDAIVSTGKHKVKGTAEVKTSRALKVQSLYSSSTKVSVLEELQRTHVVKGTRHPGYPIKFNWPSNIESASEDEKKNAEPDKQTRIIVQVYSQMKMKECDLAMLSSYETSIFFHLRKSDGVLFFSPEFPHTSNVFLATYCWMCMVIGLIPRERMCLPEVKEWWPADKWASTGADEVVGVVPASVPGFAAY